MKLWMCPICDKKYFADELSGVPNPKCGECGKRLRFPYDDSVQANLGNSRIDNYETDTPIYGALPIGVKIGTGLIVVLLLLNLT